MPTRNPIPAAEDARRDSFASRLQRLAAVEMGSPSLHQAAGKRKKSFSVASWNEDGVRLDLFLKWSRVIPRRSLAHDTCVAGYVTVNGRIATPARDIRPADVVRVVLPGRELVFRVCSVPPSAPSRAGAGEMIEILSSRRREASDS